MHIFQIRRALQSVAASSCLSGHNPVRDSRDIHTRFSWSRYLRRHRSSRFPVYSSPFPGRWIYLDSRLLELERRRWIFLGSRHLGRGARGRFALDARLLGLE